MKLEPYIGTTHLNTVYKHKTRSSQGIHPKNLVNVNDVSLNVAANKSQSTPRVNTIINYSKSLITDDNINNISDIEYINCEKDDVICIDNRWITERRKNFKNLIQLTQVLIIFESINSYNLLDHNETVTTPIILISFSTTAEFNNKK